MKIFNEHIGWISTREVEINFIMSNNAPEIARSNGDELNKEQKVIVLSIKDMVGRIYMIFFKIFTLFLYSRHLK